MSRTSRSFSRGRFELPGGPMIVSRGVGDVEVSSRAFAAKDVRCLTLVR